MKQTNKQKFNSVKHNVILPELTNLWFPKSLGCSSSQDLPSTEYAAYFKGWGWGAPLDICSFLWWYWHLKMLASLLQVGCAITKSLSKALFNIVQSPTSVCNLFNPGDSTTTETASLLMVSPYCLWCQPSGVLHSPSPHASKINTTQRNLTLPSIVSSTRYCLGAPRTASSVC